MLVDALTRDDPSPRIGDLNLVVVVFVRYFAENLFDEVLAQRHQARDSTVFVNDERHVVGFGLKNTRQCSSAPPLDFGKE